VSMQVRRTSGVVVHVNLLTRRSTQFINVFLSIHWRLPVSKALITLTSPPLAVSLHLPSHSARTHPMAPIISGSPPPYKRRCDSSQCDWRQPSTSGTRALAFTTGEILKPMRCSTVSDRSSNLRDSFSLCLVESLPLHDMASNYCCMAVLLHLCGSVGTTFCNIANLTWQSPNRGLPLFSIADQTLEYA
jgi:hypothetical protein